MGTSGVSEKDVINPTCPRTVRRHQSPDWVRQSLMPRRCDRSTRNVSTSAPKMPPLNVSPSVERWPVMVRPKLRRTSCVSRHPMECTALWPCASKAPWGAFGSRSETTTSRSDQSKAMDQRWRLSKKRPTFATIPVVFCSHVSYRARRWKMLEPKDHRESRTDGSRNVSSKLLKVVPGRKLMTNSCPAPRNASGSKIPSGRVGGLVMSKLR